MMIYQSDYFFMRGDIDNTFLYSPVPCFLYLIGRRMNGLAYLCFGWDIALSITGL